MLRYPAALLALTLLPLAACDTGDPSDPDDYRRAVITSVTIEAVPARQPDGSAWDNDPTGITSDPDLFFDLLDGGGLLVYTTEEEDQANVDQSDLPVSWSPSPGITFNQFNRTLLFEVYDKDPNSVDFMAETESFTLQELADLGFRTFVSLESSDGETVVTVRLRWER